MSASRSERDSTTYRTSRVWLLAAGALLATTVATDQIVAQVMITRFGNYRSSVFRQPPGCPPEFADGSGNPPQVAVTLRDGTRLVGWWMGHFDRHSVAHGMSCWLNIDVWCIAGGRYYRLVRDKSCTGGGAPPEQAPAPGAT